jgi:Na+/proline symporter
VTLALLDWAIVAAYVLLALAVGAYFTRRAGKNVEEFFLSGRRLPWWIAGTSLIATHFAADTPLVVTGWVRESGVWKNWLWWSFAISNVLGVFVFARLWRRGAVMTKAEVAELRYGERGGRLLRSVLGLVHAGFTNTITLCWVLLAFAKIADVTLGIDKGVALVGASTVALAYSLMAGFWGVVVTDLVQFAMAMVGAVALSVLAWNAVDGLPTALQSGGLDANVTAFFPLSGGSDGTLLTTALAVVIVNLGVGWWATEQVDGTSVTVQRVAAARDERQGTLAVLFYSFLHFALRPWPWIVVAVASLVLLPEIEVHSPVAGVVESIDAGRLVVDGTEIQLHGPGAAADWVPHPEQAEVAVGTEVEAGQVVARTDAERAYVVMMVRYLPAGLMGVVVASLLAAFMSTIDTHVNLAASFFTHDLYRARLAPGRSDRHYVAVARWASAAVMAVACFWAFFAESIGGLFTFMLAFLGGVGPVYLMRWLWWRVEARMEITAMVASALTTSLLAWVPIQWDDGALTPAGDLLHEGRLLIVVTVSTVAAMAALALGPRARPEARVDFYRRFRPPGFWKPVRELAGLPPTPPRQWTRPVLGWLCGVMALYSAMLGLGWLLFGQTGQGIAALLLFVPTGWITLRLASARDPERAACSEPS